MTLLKKISDNSLSELLCLMNRINHEIKTFSHVNELLPKELTKSINNYTDKLVKESNRREDLF